MLRVTRLVAPLRQSLTRSGNWAKTGGFRSQDNFYRFTDYSKENGSGDSGPSIMRPFLFTLVSSVGIYTGAAIYDYEERRKQQLSIAERLTSSLNRLAGWTKPSSGHGDLPTWVPEFFRDVYLETVLPYWDRLNRSEKAIYPIIAANIAVFLAWQLSPLHSIMSRYFLTSPSNPSFTLLTSTFSHKDLFHLGFNMYALFSFGPLVHATLGTAQFALFYLTAGISSSFLSLLISSYIPLASHLLLRPSLGASGALYALLGFTSQCPFPVEIGAIFVPGVSFPLATAFPFLMGLEVAGLLFKSSMFNHAAHLAGGLFGAAYFHYGPEIWKQRMKFLEAIGYIESNKRL